MMLFYTTLAALLSRDEVPGLPNLTGDQIFTNALNLFYFLMTTVAVIVIILAGLRYASSGGDSSRITGAKNQILYAVVGLVVIASAFAITNFVVGRF